VSREGQHTHCRQRCAQAYLGSGFDTIPACMPHKARKLPDFFLFV
jgi:hypothetical protein